VLQIRYWPLPMHDKCSWELRQIVNRIITARKYCVNKLVRGGKHFTQEERKVQED
jgi:hypothetical protein